MSGATYRIDQYDRLSILFADAHRALAEALETIDDPEQRTALATLASAGVTVTRFLCEEIERYAPDTHSVKA